MAAVHPSAGRMSENLAVTLSERFLRGQISRREFIKISVGTLSRVCLPTLLGCATNLYGSAARIEDGDQVVLSAALDTIFPSDLDSPGAAQIKALDYIQLVLLDPRVSDDEKRTIVDGIPRLEDVSRARYGASFAALPGAQREELIKKVIDTEWGENWISTLLTYLFEALLGDPVYGVNPDGVGWKWLEHTPGIPRPDRDHRYKFRAA